MSSSAVPDVMTCSGHDEAQQRIARAVHEIQVLCDHFGYDPAQWLADAICHPDEAPGGRWKPIETAPTGKTILVARRGSDGKKYVDLVPGDDNDFVWSAYLPRDGLDQPYAWAEPPKLPPLPRRKVKS